MPLCSYRQVSLRPSRGGESPANEGVREMADIYTEYYDNLADIDGISGSVWEREEEEEEN